MVDGLPKENSIMDFLQKTKLQIADLSRRAASATRSGIETTTETIQGKVSGTKERFESKKKAKVESIKSEIKDDGFIGEAPPMMTLPEVDVQQFELLDSQNDAQIQIVEEMVRLSERLDMLERRITKLGTAVTKDLQISSASDSRQIIQRERREVRRGNVLIEVLNIMGASLLLLVSLFSVDGYLRNKEI